MFVKVLIANEFEKVKVCEVYADEIPGGVDVVLKRFAELKETYGGANVCMASREVLMKLEV